MQGKAGYSKMLVGWMITSPISRMITKHCIFFCSMHTDLSTNTCIGCLNDEITIPWSSLGSLGGRVLYPSCILRFELFQFYNLSPTTPTNTSPSGFHIFKYMHPFKICIYILHANLNMHMFKEKIGYIFTIILHTQSQLIINNKFINFYDIISMIIVHMLGDYWKTWL